MHPAPVAARAARGEAKVAQLELPLLRVDEEQVGRLDVAVRHAVLVQVRDRAVGLREQVRRLLLAQPEANASRVHEVGERATRAVLEHRVHRPARLDHREQVGETAMLGGR